MPDIDWEQIRRDKDVYRARLAALPAAEKLVLIERLRDRAAEIRGSATPASARHRETVSNICVAVDPSAARAQRVTGNIRFGVLGADATSIAVAMNGKR